MGIRTAWIPKSERGRHVARYLRQQGFDLRNDQILGRHVCNLPCASELAAEDLRHIAYILDPDWAMVAEQEAYRTADDVRDNPRAFNVPEEEAEKVAWQIEVAWLY